MCSYGTGVRLPALWEKIVKFYPGVWDAFCFHVSPNVLDLEAILLYIIRRSFSCLRPRQIVRWLGCVVCMSKHQAFLPSCQRSNNIHVHLSDQRITSLLCFLLHLHSYIEPSFKLLHCTGYSVSLALDCLVSDKDPRGQNVSLQFTPCYVIAQHRPYSIEHRSTEPLPHHQELICKSLNLPI